MRSCIDIPWAISSELSSVKSIFRRAFVCFIAYMLNYNGSLQICRAKAPREVGT
jgi:hypothetical protein